MSLDFTPLENAMHQLEKGLGYATSAAAQADAGLFEQLRNSVIQCFEFTYRLSHKMLKRYLEETTANPEEFDLGTFQNLIRTGNEKGLEKYFRPYNQHRPITELDDQTSDEFYFDNLPALRKAA